MRNTSVVTILFPIIYQGSGLEEFELIKATLNKACNGQLQKANIVYKKLSSTDTNQRAVFYEKNTSEVQLLTVLINNQYKGKMNVIELFKEMMAEYQEVFSERVIHEVYNNLISEHGFCTKSTNKS